MFIKDAFAQAAAASSSGSLKEILIQLGLIFLIFYILLIRPQQKKIKQHEAVLRAIKKGDRILTGGGIYGIVVKADDLNEVEVEIAQDVKIVVSRASIRDVIFENMSKPEIKKEMQKTKPANSNKKEKK